MLIIRKINSVFTGGAIGAFVDSFNIRLMVLPSMGKWLLRLGFGILTPAVVIILNFLYETIASCWFVAAGRDNA